MTEVEAEEVEHLASGGKDLVTRGDGVVRCRLPGEFCEEGDHCFVWSIRAFEGVI